MRSFLLTFVVLAVGLANGRVFYLQSVEDTRDPVNPAIPPIDNREQSSRDLDLSFTAGDSVDSVDSLDSVDKENESVIQAKNKKIYTLVAAPERPVATINKGIGRPVSYFKLAEVSAKRNDREDVIIEPQRSPKQLKISGGKGDVVVELRVIANHDDA